jgi:DNA-binding IscR family transcriptional regulator
MAYRTGLAWMGSLPSYTEEERKVLLALSHEKYKWRTRDRVVKVTDLSPTVVDTILAGLMEKNVVVVSRGKSGNIIFGLREIVRG